MLTSDSQNEEEKRVHKIITSSKEFQEKMNSLKKRQIVIIEKFNQKLTSEKIQIIRDKIKYEYGNKTPATKD